MDIWTYVVLGLMGVLPITIGILVYPKIKRMIYRAIHTNLIVCHMFAEVGGQYMEVRTNLIPVGVSTFKNNKRSYTVDPSKIVWRPTGMLGGNELNLYYIVGRIMPISMSRYDDKAHSDSSELFQKTMKEGIWSNFLGAEIPKTYLYIILGLGVLLVISVVVIAYLVMNGAGGIVQPPR